MIYPMPKPAGETQSIVNGLPTYPYAPPILRHVGRFVDSQDTGNLRVTFRVARARNIRAYPAQNRVVVQIGNGVCVYRLDRFLAGLPLTSQGVGPGQLVAKWDGVLYPEARDSGWTFGSPDSQDPIGDGIPFDYDDRGYLYAGYPVFGWGIAKDDGRVNGSHLPFVVQVTDIPTPPDSIIAFKAGAKYLAIIACVTGDHQLFDVTDPSAPQFVTARGGAQFGVRRYDRQGDRVAWVDGANHLQVSTFAELAGDGRSIMAAQPSERGGFVDVSFDEAGNVWAVESTRLWRFAVSGASYTATAFTPFEGLSQIRSLAVGAGLIAAVGTDRSSSPVTYDVRLCAIDPAGPRPLRVNSFFRNYYHGGSPNYAKPGPYTIPADLALVARGGKAYLLYAAEGLGDVYELVSSGAVVVPPVVPPPVDVPCTCAPTCKATKHNHP